MLIFRLIILFWSLLEKVYMLQFLKNPSVFSYCPVLLLSFPPLSESLCFTSCLLKAPSRDPVCSDWSAHTCMTQQRWQQQSSWANCNMSNLLLCKCVTWWLSVMSQSHRIKGGTPDEVFQGHCFLWERGAAVGEDLVTFISFKIFDMQQNVYKH